MGILNKLGTIIYYIGLAALMYGFLTLGMGIVDILSGVVTQVNSFTDDGQIADCLTPPCDVSTNSTFSRLPLGYIGGFVKYLENEIHTYFTSLGLFSSDSSFQGMYVPLFLRFFALLIMGMILIVIGIIFHLLDALKRFVTGEKGKGKKDRFGDKLKIRVSDKLSSKPIVKTRNIRKSIKDW